MNKTVNISYNADTLETTISADGKEFDTSRISGKTIEDWTYPFMVRKVKWDGIFDELNAFLGTDEYDILFSGSRDAMKVLMEDCPETVSISFQKNNSETVTRTTENEEDSDDIETPDDESNISENESDSESDEAFILNNKYTILSHELSYSDERLEFVRLKWEYQRKAWNAEEVIKEALPEAKNIGALKQVSAFLGNTLSDLTSLTGAATSFLSEGNYKHFAIFQEVRNEYVDKYVECLNKEIDSLAEELAEQSIFVDKSEILAQILKKSNFKNDMYEATKLNISSRNKDKLLTSTYETQAAHNKISNYYVNKANLEYDSDNSIIFSSLKQPLNHCFLELVKSDIGEMNIDVTDINNDKNTINVAQKCSKIVFQLEDIQNTIIDNLSNDVFCIFLIKKRFLEEAGLKKYDIIKGTDSKRAREISEQLKNKSYSEEEEKELMAECLQLDPFQSGYYTSILKKYYDENGDIQRLAKDTTVNVTTYIENYMIDLYNNGDIGTLDSTLELKDKILAAEAKFCYKDSKGFKKALYRQHFLELGLIADDMNYDEIISTWQAIKGGNNTFAGEARNDVDDDSCILILTRRLLKKSAEKYHDVIRDLGLKDDQTEGDKNYAFYEEGDNYLDFEEECFKIIGCKLEHDTDFANQNYTDDKLASAEVILGYFHYTRAMDIISDGKCLLITNQRIYTTKERFTRFDEISTCTPTKNMLSTSLVFEKTDGKTIQLPVSKELAVPAADMINRLLSALKNEEYIAESVEMSESKALNATKSTILGAASSAKKGFSSLFGKKNKE